MKILYRTSESGYNKVKPEYVNNENCLKNFCNIFSEYVQNIYVIADNCSDNTNNFLNKYIDSDNIKNVSIGNGAGTFNIAFDIALEWNDDDIVYFIENDYIHVENSPNILKEAFTLGVDFVSLYDHPDKYMNHVNPYVEDGGEVTKVFLTNSCHWKFTNSTTMTFAAKVSTLKKYKDIIKKWTSTTHPHDFEMWIDLRNNGASLITPLPGYATHGESAWLCPLIDWETKIK